MGLLHLPSYIQGGSLWFDVELDGVHIRVERVTKYSAHALLRHIFGWRQYKMTSRGDVLRWDGKTFNKVGEHGTC